MKVIVSLTSFPARINAAAQVIEKMTRQTRLPDKIVLYLTESQFPDKKLPRVLEKLRGDLVDIRFCGLPIRSYTKLVPALSDFPDDIIITVDDDIDYPDNLVQEFMRMHKKFPHAVISNRVRRIKLIREPKTENRKPNVFSPRFSALGFRFSPYASWPLYRSLRKYLMTPFPHAFNLAMGVGGVLYPPHSLHKDVLRNDIFMKIAPTADDLWFWAMARRNGTKIAYARNPRVKERVIGGTQESSLMSENCANGANDRIMANLLAEYPDLAVIR
jgi:hypothetical protein